MNRATLAPELLPRMDAYWRAANYLSLGQIYLYDNPLLKEPLAPAHAKPLVIGHWGTTPGQNFIYVHLNRVIKVYDLAMFYVTGPGHGGPALVANTYLKGSYSEIHPNISQNEAAFDIRVQNEPDRFHLVQNVVDRVAHLGTRGDYLKQLAQDKLIEHKQYID